MNSTNLHHFLPNHFPKLPRQKQKSHIRKKMWDWVPKKLTILLSIYCTRFSYPLSFSRNSGNFHSWTKYQEYIVRRISYFAFSTKYGLCRRRQVSLENHYPLLLDHPHKDRLLLESMLFIWTSYEPIHFLITDIYTYKPIPNCLETSWRTGLLVPQRFYLNRDTFKILHLPSRCDHFRSFL